MIYSLRLSLITLGTFTSMAFAAPTPAQQRAIDLVDQLSKRVFTTLALSNPQARQAEFCSMAQYLDFNNAANQLVKSWADRYGQNAADQDQKEKDKAAFIQLLPEVISNDMLSLFESIDLVGGGYEINSSRFQPKGSKATGVVAVYRDVNGKTYDIVFTVSTDSETPKLLDASTSILTLVANKQSDYDKRMRTAYDSGKTGHPIDALNKQLEAELKFRCK